MPDGAPDTDMQTAIDSLANIFWDILSSRDGITFEEFEERALTCGHGVMAQATTPNCAPTSPPASISTTNGAAPSSPRWAT